MVASGLYIMPERNFVERRLTLRLVAYWERLRGERPMPSENDIDPEDLAELWDFCFLVQVKDLAKKDFNYTYLGSAIVEAYRGGLSGDDPTALVTPDPKKLAFNYTRVINTKLPVIEEGEFSNLRGDTVKFRQCMLPLGQGPEVEAIFGGMRFKISDTD
jgi:hypothetical protein